MPHDALSAKNAAPQQHTNVARGSQKQNGAHEKGHGNGKSSFLRSSLHHSYATDPGKETES
jgi:hypothetical protein